MPEFYTWTVLLVNQLGEIGEKQLSVYGSSGGQICPLMHVPLWNSYLKEYIRYAKDSMPIPESRSGQGHGDPMMVRDTSSSQDACTHQIWDSYLK